MNWSRIGLLLVLLGASATPAQAQLFFPRKNPVNASQRVPELILTIKVHPDERKRVHAAEELRNYDAATFTEIVPVLADVLLNDKKSNVRHEALISLSRIRPVQPAALQAMEKAASQDEAWRVRFQAKAVLAKLQVVAFATKKSEPAAPAAKKPTNEPVSLESYLHGNTPREGQVTDPTPRPDFPRPFPQSPNQFETPPSMRPLQPVTPVTPAPPTITPAAPTPLPTLTTPPRPVQPVPPTPVPVQQGPSLFP